MLCVLTALVHLHCLTIPHAVHAVLLSAADSQVACCRQFEHGAYQQWRQQTLDEAAYECAQHAAVDRLVLLLHRHPHRLMSELLSIMGQLPETAAVDVYAQLLDQVSVVTSSHGMQLAVNHLYLFSYHSIANIGHASRFLGSIYNSCQIAHMAGASGTEALHACNQLPAQHSCLALVQSNDITYAALAWSCAIEAVAGTALTLLVLTVALLTTSYLSTKAVSWSLPTSSGACDTGCTI